ARTEALGLLAVNDQSTCRDLSPVEGLAETLQIAERCRPDLVAGFVMQSQLNRPGCLRPRQGFSRVGFHEWSDFRQVDVDRSWERGRPARLRSAGGRSNSLRSTAVQTPA